MFRFLNVDSQFSCDYLLHFAHRVHSIICYIKTQDLVLSLLSDMSAPLPTSSGSTNATSTTTPGCVTAMPGAGCGETFITPRYEANTPTIAYVTTPTTSTSTATDTTPGIITDVTMAATHDRTTQFRKSQVLHTLTLFTSMVQSVVNLTH